MNKKYKETTHSFEVEDVKKYGSIEKALIMKELKQMAVYKIRHNKEGWVYYSVRALEEKFPYMKKTSIDRWLKELEKDGWLKTRIKNKQKYDKTKSFFPTELEGVSQNMNSVSQNGTPLSQNGTTIPSLSSSLNNTNKNSNAATSKNANSNQKRDSKNSKRGSESALPNGRAPYGDPIINFFIEQLKLYHEIATLDGSEKENRRYAKLLINKIVKQIRLTEPVNPSPDRLKRVFLNLLDRLKRDQFLERKATSMKFIYYNFNRILNL